MSIVNKPNATPADKEKARLQNRIAAQKWREKNREASRKYQAEYHRNLYQTNEIFKLQQKVRNFIWSACNACLKPNRAPHTAKETYERKQTEVWGTTFRELGSWIIKKGYADENKVVDHIIPLDTLCNVFGIKEKSILIDRSNLQILTKNGNNKKWKHIYCLKQLEVAGVMERKYPELKGLTTYVESELKKQGVI